MAGHSTLSGLDLHEAKRTKEPVRAATTVALTLSAPGATIDGVTLASGDRVLVKDQVAPAQNGLYTWSGAASALVRTTDADAAADFVHGFQVYVREGTSNTGTTWVFTQSVAITLETTFLTFVALARSQSSAAVSILAARLFI